LKRTAALMGFPAARPVAGAMKGAIPGGPMEEFGIYQERRRAELWSLLGDLPWSHEPRPATLLKTEKGEGYTLERLLLDLNGLEPVPALLLIPDRRQKPAPVEVQVFRRDLGIWDTGWFADDHSSNHIVPLQ